MITVEKVFLGQDEPVHVEISFQLDDRGWKKLEASHQWKRFEKYLEALQTEDRATGLQAPEARQENRKSFLHRFCK